jgi:hypothetical protein
LGFAGAAFGVLGWLRPDCAKTAVARLIPSNTTTNCPVFTERA